MAVIKKGSTGGAVQRLQSLLQNEGYQIDVDGVFGQYTEKIVKKYQLSKGLVADGIVGAKTWQALEGVRQNDVELNLPIIDIPLAAEHYFNQTHKKTQIVLHHTASSHNVNGILNWWKSDGVRVGTPFIVGGDGRIYRVFDEQHAWAWHLGVGSAAADSRAIGIEITNWGHLTKRGDKFYNYVNGEVPANEVYELPKAFKGHKYYHKYTPQQIATTKQLVLELSDKYQIPIKPNQYGLTSGWWDYNAYAIRGAAGLWSHNNFRVDKTDISPDPNMIEMLNSL